MNPEPFSTARLAMRPMRDDDAVALHEAYRDEGLMRYWSSAPHTTLAQTQAYIVRDAVQSWCGWSITQGDDGRVLGTVAATERRPGVVEIGYLMVRSAWGRGYAREAVGTLIERLFAEGYRRVFADTDPDNAPSIRLLESLGFVREGLLRAEWETHIGVRDSVILGLLREEWRGRDTFATNAA